MLASVAAATTTTAATATSGLHLATTYTKRSFSFSPNLADNDE